MTDGKFTEACYCPEGYKGNFCEVKAVPCGNYMCYNGATCVAESVLDGIPVSHCDCRTATSASGKQYAGMYCQYEETTKCASTHSIEARLFCVNDGQCKQDGVLGCECPPGYAGFSCEFHIGAGSENSGTDGSDIGMDGDGSPVPQIDDAPECTLNCGENGTCRHGIKDTSNLGNAAHAEGISENHDNLQHCVCKDGFVGLKCDRPVSVCGDDQFCMYGSECKKDENGSYFCDCSTVNNETAYNGPSCEFTVSSRCNVISGDDSHFCVNGGRCKTLSRAGDE